ncbi:MAG TPA: circularly permuted type 2 ATP-grasp protein [Steroidobacteraceae bacterium]|nr:circularly permuted type 2 ATP-grasp protein [Steroidobacteraceae bacterium]
MDGDGVVRSHWQTLVEGIFENEARAVRRATEFTRRMIVENGITYNVYADLKGRDRPWVLDPLPYLISALEWQAIEAGVAQRARLLNAVLVDLYGKQELLSQGALPAEIPFGHPNFLWPCTGVRLPADRWLSIYAADLARSADGRWWVLADRTQAPSGPGYALENRQIVRRAFPHLAQSMDVRPLGAFFATLRDELLRGADEEPMAVVLTPGSFNETYFEHAYLARQLGFPLVEGHDLTVRDESVYLKTLSGLKRVHTILRRLDDDFCDPVELRVDSALGVPGLLAAVRAGKVVVANGLGSGVLESAAWLGFLPAIAEQLIGEKLRLPSVASWWCGEPPAFASVVANLSNLVIKPSFPNQKLGPVFGSELSADERNALVERMRARPHAFVAQEHLAFSQAPVWYSKDTDGLCGRALGIRVYAIATPHGYRVMPGGLARFASDAHAEIVSMQRGGGSKDIWVLCDFEEASEATAPIARVDRAPSRHHDLPSTLVENLFWMGRYAERCDYKTRLLRATLGLRRNLPFRAQAMEICKHFGASAVFDAEKRFTLSGDIERLGECAAQVRGSLSGENWRALTVLQRDFRRAETAHSDARETLDSLLLSLAALAGFALDDMTQDDGWRLMMIGRRLERLQFLADVISRRLVSLGTPLRQELEWLLEIGDSAITYRTRFRAPPAWSTTIDLLVYDEKNPRALAFQWRAINTMLIEVAESLGSKPQETLYEAVSNLLELKYANLGGEFDMVQVARPLAPCLKDLMAAAAQLSDQLTSQHFSHVDFDLRAVSA